MGTEASVAVFHEGLASLRYHIAIVIFARLQNRTLHHGAARYPIVTKTDVTVLPEGLAMLCHHVSLVVRARLPLLTVHLGAECSPILAVTGVTVILVPLSAVMDVTVGICTCLSDCLSCKHKSQPYLLQYITVNYTSVYNKRIYNQRRSQSFFNIMMLSIFPHFSNVRV